MKKEENIPEAESLETKKLIREQLSIRRLNPWWKVRRSCDCGDKVAAATTRVWKGVWIVEGME